MYVCASNEPKTELVKSKVYNLQPSARMDSVSTLHLWLEVRFGGRVLGWRRRLRGRRGLGGGGRRLSVVELVVIVRIWKISDEFGMRCLCYLHEWIERTHFLELGDCHCLMSYGCLIDNLGALWRSRCLEVAS